MRFFSQRSNWLRSIYGRDRCFDLSLPLICSSSVGDSNSESGQCIGTANVCHGSASQSVHEGHNASQKVCTLISSYPLHTCTHTGTYQHMHMHAHEAHIHCTHCTCAHKTSKHMPVRMHALKINHNTAKKRESVFLPTSEDTLKALQMAQPSASLAKKLMRKGCSHCFDLSYQE